VDTAPLIVAWARCFALPLCAVVVGAAYHAVTLHRLAWRPDKWQLLVEPGAGRRFPHTPVSANGGRAGSLDTRSGRNRLWRRPGPRTQRNDTRTCCLWVRPGGDVAEPAVMSCRSDRKALRPRGLRNHDCCSQPDFLYRERRRQVPAMGGTFASPRHPDSWAMLSTLESY
jgi:hypothetical protein